MQKFLTRNSQFRFGVLFLWVFCLCFASVGLAQESAEGDASLAEMKERVQKLESEVSTLADELSDALTAVAVPDDWNYDVYYGVAPTASQVYGTEKGLSIGGYGEIRFRHQTASNDIYDALRLVSYIGYKFNEKWVVNTEVEFEHGGAGSESSDGSVSMEFMNLDYLHSETINFRIGLVLVPMGLINRVHEPLFYRGASRPEVERQIIPSTWSENGAGIFGRLGDRVRYHAYAINGFDGIGFNGSGLRGGRQGGSEALANNWAFVGRMDADTLPGLTVGGSFYYGNSGQDQADSTGQSIGSLGTTLYEFHAEYKAKGFGLRVLFTQAFIDNPNSLNATNVITDATAMGAADDFLAESLLGWYVEGGYDVLPWLFPNSKMSLEPFFRYERLDTQYRMQPCSTCGPTYGSLAQNDRHIFMVGVGFKPIEAVVIKLDYRAFVQASDDRTLNEQVELGVGFQF
jgi:hypothetical protein